MKKITLITVLLFTSYLFSQTKFNSEDFTVNRADLELNTYAKDTTANALVIYEHGNSFIDKHDFKLRTQIKRKLKILNRNGFDKATITIYLYHNKGRKEKIDNIHATTYNLENGNVKRVELTKSQIFEEQYNDNYTIVKFTFPAVKEGSVLVYSYDLETPFIYKYRSWAFQDNIPKLYSEYNTSIPGNYEYNAKLVGDLKLSYHHYQIQNNCIDAGGGATANCVVTTYKMVDIPAFINENYMTTRDNYLSRLEYELEVIRHFDGRVDNITKSWKDVDNELKSDANLGKQLNKTSGIKDLLNESIANEPDILKKATAIYKYVQENYTWNEEYSLLKDVSVKNVIENKSGKVSEINILLHNLLEENDIDVKPVILSTRNNGLPTKVYPIISDFNYLILQVNIDGQTYLLDATDKYLAFGEIPYRCLNQYGRLLDFKNGSEWIDIKPSKISTIQYKVELDITEEETLQGTISTKNSGYHARSLKEAYFGNPQEYLKYFSNKYNTIDFINHKANTTDKTDFEFSDEFEVNYTTDNVGDKLYVNPFLFKFFTENPFKLQERSYPIDFGYKDAYLYTLKINTENYEVLEVPKDLKMALPNNKGLLIFVSKVEDQSVSLYFKFNFNEAIYDSSYYEALKAFMAKVIDIQKNSLIVLTKK